MARVERTGAEGLPAPGRTSRWLVLAPVLMALTGLCSRGYGAYNQALLGAPDSWGPLLRGTADAPEQYRIGAILAGHWLARFTHLRLSQAFATLDLLGALAAALLLHAVLVRSLVYRRAGAAGQWIGLALWGGLFVYYADWANWYQKVPTWPTAGLIALLLWLWTEAMDTRPAGGQRREAGLVAGLVLTAVAQAFVRADIALTVSFGMLLVQLLRPGADRAVPTRLSRGAAIAVSALSVLAVGAIQLYLMRVRYPHATYGDVRTVMIFANLRNPPIWATFFIFSSPVLWTIWQAWKRRFHEDLAGTGFLLGGMGFLLMWLVLGRSDEVRIYLPMALALTPLTVQLLLLAIGAVPPPEAAIREA